MIYLLAAATVTMLGYMFWSTAFRMRHERVKAQRKLTKGKFVLRPKERARFLLGRAFPVASEKPEWERDCLSTLDAHSEAAARPPAA